MTTSSAATPQGNGLPDLTGGLPDDSHLRAVLGCIASSRMIYIYRPDVSEQVICWSPGSAKQLGYQPEELQPSIDALHSLVHPHDLAILLDRSSVVDRQAGGDFACAYRLRRKDGEYLWVRSITSTYRPPDPRAPIASLEVLRVLEQGPNLDRDALQLSEDALNTVLNEIGYPVVLMSPEGFIVQANRAAAQFSGAPNARSGFCPFLHCDDGTLLFPGFLEDVILLGLPASRELERFGRWWHIHLVPIRDAQRNVARILLLAQDISDLKAEQAAQLERERALRDTLVREVHHRIKNHLQGVVGLLRRQPQAGGTRADQMDAAVTQIQSIAAVHGLLARSARTCIDLRSLIAEIVAAQRATSALPVYLSCDLDAFPPVELSESESIPLAVAVGELLTNAVKHTQAAEGARVSVTLQHHPDRVELSIANSPAALPPEFRVEAWSGGQSGLALVLTLLAHGRARFALEQHLDRVVARLDLRPR